jgi:hypothetical protein
MRSFHRSILCFALVPAALVAVACSSTSTPNNPDAALPDTGPADAAPPDAVAASCSAPGMVTPGPADNHCVDTDGGTIVQPTSLADCHPDVGAPDAPDMCAYDSTKFGLESDDDDCKYHVKWSSSAICEQTSPGVGAVIVTVVATHKDDGTPLTGANTVVEFFTTPPGDADCDDMSTHPGFNSGVMLTEGPPGTYTGPLYFDAPGAWTVRFHFHEECADILPTSPHGHAAFHVTVP